MHSTRLALIGSIFMLAGVPACQGKSTAPAPTDAKQAAQAAGAKQAPADAKAAPVAAPADAAGADGGGPSPDEVAAVEGAAAQAPPATDPAKALGAHLADPRWYRKTMFGDKGKVLDTKRSQADDQGRFSSLIRFELVDMTPEACADHLQKLVADEVSNVERTVQPDGRVQLVGSTDRYKLTFLCGQTEGKTIAYVSYQWT